MLGFQEGKALDTAHYDLVFVHVGPSEKMNDIKGIEIVNNLVGELLHMAQCETDISSRLHMSIIMSCGATQEDDRLEFSVSDAKSKNNSELQLLIPCQSYMTKGGKLREDIRQHSPMLLAQYQNAVTRKDTGIIFFYGFSREWWKSCYTGRQVHTRSSV